jgi:tetratricopeptide (TPR) repeat protein
VDPAEPQAPADGADPGALPIAGEQAVLQAFYEHLGTLVAGKAGDEDHGRWMATLSRSGLPEIADAWENLELLRGNEQAHADGLLELAWTVGRRLRHGHAPAHSFEEAVEGWMVEPGAPLPSPTDSSATRDYDVRRLVNLLAVGGLSEKRRVATDLGDFLVHRRKLANERLFELALDTLASNRDPAVTLEVTESLARVGGAEAKRAKASVERMEAFFAKLVERIRHFWDGALKQDPIDGLPDADLVAMGIWLRRAPDYISGHIAEYLLARLGREETGALAGVTSALVPSGDARLLPVLVRVLQDADYEARVAAIKAIAHIDDPRSLGALRKAFRHATDALERVMLARALSTFGDASGLGCVLESLGDGSPTFVREEALKAVGLFPGIEPATIAGIESLVESPSPALAAASLRALSRLGDASTLERLELLGARTPVLRSAAHRAAIDLRARLVLGGDERFDRTQTDLEPAVEKRPGPILRLRSVLWYLVGLVFVALKDWARARAAASRASRINPSSAKGHFLEAYALVREGSDEAAIECYRRGLQVDGLFPVRQWGEADRVLSTYLRHAQVLGRRQGSRDEAIELLEETEFIDLGSADPNLKLEVDRRLEALKLERRRERLEMEKG